jgi:hypothetical protein
MAQSNGMIKNATAPAKLLSRRSVLLFLALIAMGLAARGAVLQFRPFWMDERFSAALATQPLSEVIEYSAKDVHPPLYYLLLWAWNKPMAASRIPPAEITDYNLERIGATGEFTILDRDGEKRISGIYPSDYWGEKDGSDHIEAWHKWPLAPLWFLRMPSAMLGLLAGALTFLLGRRLWPERPEVAFIALAVAAIGPFTLTWDTVARSYSLQAALAAALASSAIAACDCSATKRHAIILAALTTASLLTGYIVTLVLPCIAGVLWFRSEKKSRALWLLAGIAAGAIAAAVIWGPSFLAQSGLRRVPPELASAAFPERLGDQTKIILDALWRSVFSYGLTGYLNPFNTPIVWTVAYLFYVACILANFSDLIRRRTPATAAIFALALGPFILIALANAVRPETIPVHARYFYPFALFFYLFLANGAALILAPLFKKFAKK